MIRTNMTGEELDRVLGAFADVQNQSLNGQVLYILQGELATTEPDNLFDIVIPTGGGG